MPGQQAASKTEKETVEIKLAHSPDSDDAFMFYALATHKLATPGYKYTHILSDIQSLNEAALSETYDVTAISFAAYPALRDKYILLDCGASFGEGYGPIVVSSKSLKPTELAGKRIAVPGLKTRNGNALSGKLGGLQGFGRNYNRTVAFAETGAAIQEDVFVTKGRIGCKTDGRDVVRFAQRSLVQRLDIRQDVSVFVTGRGKLMRGQSIKHEGVIGIRRMRQLDLDRLFLGFRGCLLARHGRVRFLFRCDPAKSGTFARNLGAVVSP